MLRLIFNFLLFFLILMVVIGTGLAFYVVPDLPEISTLKDVQFQIPLRVYSKDGSLIAEYGEKKRIPVNIEEVPRHMVSAILAAEDDRFYKHPGVDWQGLVRAVVTLAKTGEKKQGGSTITMQVARNFFLSREKTYLRKLNEIFLALKIERELSKDEILELYLNKIYLGQRAYGIATAAQIYYGKPLQELSLEQFAMLAGLPKAPSTNNPISNPKRALERRQYVLDRMVNVGFITADEHAVASKQPITASLYATDIELEAPYVGEMVRSQLLQEYGEDIYTLGLSVYTTIQDKNQIAANAAIRKSILEYDERHGYRGVELKADREEVDSVLTEEVILQRLEKYTVVAELYPAVVTAVNEKTFDAYLKGIGSITVEWEGMSWARKFKTENLRGPAPKNAADIVNQGDVVRVKEDRETGWQLTQIPQVEAALVSLNPNNGAMLALVGGFDFYHSKFNRARQAKRQPGSGFKPFIYSAGLAAGESAASIFNDAPIVFDDPGISSEWRPENYGHDYKGPMRMRSALTQSRNLVSIRLLDKIGVNFALQHAQKFGFDIESLPKNLSLALGSGEITPWQQARAYSVFANGGFLIEPYFIERIADPDNLTVFQASPKQACLECEQELATSEPVDTSTASETFTNDVMDTVPERYAPRVVEKRNIWLMNSITQDVIKYGTGRRALSLKRNDLSGKTGTTNDQRDAWFSGFNGDVVAIVWTGFDKFSPLGRRETGASAALPMWIDYMRVALDGMPEKVVPKPTGLVSVRINPITGKATSSANPDGIFETFRVENAPKASAPNSTADPYINATDGTNLEQLF